MNLTGILEVVRLTDVGKRREHNEDAIASDVEIGLVVLADGMGGYKAGEVASEMAILTIIAELKESITDFSPGRRDAQSGMQAEAAFLLDAVAKANQAIYSVSQSQPQCAGMGTTLVVGLFTNDRLLVGHIGDSRMYRLRDGALQQITEDHSLLQEQIRSGLITPEQARQSGNKNLVTRALGVDPEVELELHEHAVLPGDLYLVCSDGLTDTVEDADIHLTLTTLNANLELAAHQLVDMANDAGGKDNISVILACVHRPFPAAQRWYQRFLNWLK